MSAKVYKTPKELDAEKHVPFSIFTQGREVWEKAEKEYLDKLRTWCKKNTDSKNPLVGEIVATGVADGYAQYMVFRTQPLELIHIELGDAWHADQIWLRGLRVADVKRMVEADKKMAELFS